MRLRSLVWLLVGGVVASCVLGIIAVLVELSYRPTYDKSDPDYRRYVEAFDRLGATKEVSIDLSQLNNGEWKTACLFGGYTMPLDEMQALGASINEKDRARLTEAGSRGFRLGQVEEFEIAIAFVDLNNNAHFIHFATGIGPEGQHLRRCISKPETRLFLAAP